VHYINTCILLPFVVDITVIKLTDLVQYRVFVIRLMQDVALNCPICNIGDEMV